MIEFDLAEIIKLSHTHEREDIHTAMPGRVTAYDPTTQLADVQLMIKMPTFDDDGNRIAGTSYPVLPKVPVIWPRSSGFMHVLPMAQGDFVWVMFSEGGTGEFRTTAEESEPFDVSRHQITYPYCVPGCVPDTTPITDASVTGNAMAVWGQEGGPQIQNDGSFIRFQSSGSTSDPGDAPALASKVDANFTAIKNFLTLLLSTPTLLTYINTAGTPTPCVYTGAAPSIPNAATKSALIKCK